MLVLSACQSGPVNPTAARHLLGVSASADAVTVRRAYRRLMRANHPDVTADPDAHARAAVIIEAYEVASEALADRPTVQEPAARTAPPPATPPSSRVREQRLPATNAMTYHPTLVEACTFLGEIIGVDSSEPSVQVRIESEGHGDASLLVQLEERGHDLVAICSLEPLGVGSAPAIDEVVADLHRALAIVDA